MTRNNKQERQFLRYLDALENADIEGIGTFLHSAELDPQLEQMLVEHHNEESLMIPSKIRPFVLPAKRKNKPGKRVSSTLVATLLMTLAGVIAIFISTQSAQPTPLTSTNDFPASTPVTSFGFGGMVDTLDENTAAVMRNTAMVWVRLRVDYDPAAIPDLILAQVAEIHAAGFRVLLSVTGTPEDVTVEGYFDQYAAFTGLLAAAGADAIEIWDSQNLDRNWPTGRINPVLYSELLAKSHGAIKAANPNTFIITGALAPTGAERAFPGQVMNDDRYLREMVAAGALDYADCVGMQYTEGVVPPTQRSGDPRDDYYTRYYTTMIETYWQIIAGQRPLCLTELGYLAGAEIEDLPSFVSWASDTTREEQAAWLADAIQLARLSDRFRIVTIWNLNAEIDESAFSAGYRIVQEGGICRACSIAMLPPLPLLEIAAVSNSGNLNSEAVFIRSRDNIPLTIQAGWALEDLDGHHFPIFPSGNTFSNTQIPIYTHDRQPLINGGYTLGQDETIWEPGDLAILRDNNGRIHDVYWIPERAE